MWQSAADRLWCVSTRWDSLPLDHGMPVVVNHIELLPAKGGGAVILEIGEWSVRAGYPSREVADAVAASRRYARRYGQAQQGL